MGHLNREIFNPYAEREIIRKEGEKDKEDSAEEVFTEEEKMKMMEELLEERYEKDALIGSELEEAVRAIEKQYLGINIEEMPLKKLEKLKYNKAVKDSASFYSSIALKVAAKILNRDPKKLH